MDRKRPTYKRGPTTSFRNKYNGRASHSQLMNASHMKKREFREVTESLIEREALTVEAVRLKNGKTGKVYVLNDLIMESWVQK